MYDDFSYRTTPYSSSLLNPPSVFVLLLLKGICIIFTLP